MHLTEGKDLISQPQNSHMTQKVYEFVQLNLTKSDMLNTSSPDDQQCETPSHEFLSCFYPYYLILYLDYIVILLSMSLH